MNLWLPRAGGERIVRDGHVHTVIFKMNNQQGSIYSVAHGTRWYVAAWVGGGFEGEWISVYV